MIKRDFGQVSFYSHIYDTVIPKDHFFLRGEDLYSPSPAPLLGKEGKFVGIAFVPLTLSGLL